MNSSPLSSAKTLTTVIAMTLSVVFTLPSAQAALTTLDDAQRAILVGIPEDPAPKKLVRGNHYLISNEDRPHLFYKTVAARGGVMVGVGTDQLYVYAAWARSELLIPMDFDKTVVDLHRIYTLLFTKAATPADFIQLWHKRHRKTVRGWLDSYEPDPALRKRLGYAFKIGRQLVYARLKRLHLRYKDSQTPTFVSDQAQYDHLVSLITQGRFRAVRGDLTKSGCLKGLGEALVKLGHTLDVIYLSNAEQYFDFKQPFRDNFLNLPVDDASLVLRTSPRNGGKGQYRYETQRTVDFQAWLRRPTTKRVKQIRRHRLPGPEKDTTTFPAPPE
jgi:hypothetical protein